MNRFVKVVQHNLGQYLCAVHRTKKPFNPMLGETYELVTEHFKFMSEQVSHHPPISAYIQEGNGYTLTGCMYTKSKLGFGGGTG